MPLVDAPVSRKVQNKPLQEKFQDAREELQKCLIERNDEIDIVLTAMICQEHVLLIGPPGTAKSMLLEYIMDWIHGPKFTVLFSKYTVPEEVFGPLSLQALKQDQFTRVGKGMLQEAIGAFGDEIFKASSAILNTLLKILNKRLYIENGIAKKTDLRIFVAGSNEFPGGENGGHELGALYDRFLFRKKVKPVSPKNQNQLWFTDLPSPQFPSHISLNELDKAFQEASVMTWEAESEELFGKIVRSLNTEGIVPGDRRQRKAVKAVKAFAWMNQHATVEPTDLMILKHILWEDPSHEIKTREIVEKISNPELAQLNQLMVEAMEILKTAGQITKLSTGMVVAKKLEDVKKRSAKLTSSDGKELTKWLNQEINKVRMADFEEE
jgi:MoxR-like ATPase